MRTSGLDNPERKAVIRLGPSPRGERASARSCFLSPFLPKLGLKSGRGTYFLDGNAWRGRLGFGSLAGASVAEVLPCSSSSLPHQQHGEFRRVKENNRGNGAREVGFKPPLTTHKQQHWEDARARRKRPEIGARARITCNRTDSPLHLGAKYLFSSSPMFCFSRFGTPRAPGNGPCYAIGRPGVRGVVGAFLPGPARASTGAFQRCSCFSDQRYQLSMSVHQLSSASVNLWERGLTLWVYFYLSIFVTFMFLFANRGDGVCLAIWICCAAPSESEYSMVFMLNVINGVHSSLQVELTGAQK